MAAQPFIDYVDYTGNQTFMKETAYPYVREVAAFYASYLKRDTDGLYGVPYGCAQELCSGRQSGDRHPQKDDTIDLAYSRWIFSKAIEWGGKLGEPAVLLAKWKEIANSLKPYPLTDQFQPPAPHGKADSEEWCAASNCAGFSEAVRRSHLSPGLVLCRWLRAPPDSLALWPGQHRHQPVADHVG